MIGWEELQRLPGGANGPPLILSKVDWTRATEVTEEVDHQIEDLFNTYTYDGVKASKIATVRRAICDAAKVIVANVPPCASRTVALRKLVEAKMDSILSISNDGRF